MHSDAQQYIVGHKNLPDPKHASIYVKESCRNQICIIIEKQSIQKYLTLRYYMYLSNKRISYLKYIGIKYFFLYLNYKYLAMKHILSTVIYIIFSISYFCQLQTLISVKGFYRYWKLYMYCILRKKLCIYHQCITHTHNYNCRILMKQYTGYLPIIGHWTHM